ncbi:TIGR03617 family F420-dependent LLM class oxidoreductase [Gordonia alkanivorans]|uniref:TIGR03617 family F420-dependent LLM class oxidoreductase n=1 Tax=Gordonia alkanivorans TaxID=84096 RepID=UPI00244C4876|nr:TIGR03617 family F420-dependent LLM class oxidoreductase [Gordonia alkanivorans]MDH3008937.1 TIGR03617 family F420-dependent LLM class oxidoreductase [Gordonia alkanivorans]MDH3017898.1 TIGR03617 family F420-dependent LLM class oxidoreductase [Gordonia alkanivorans]MDH3043268.1 TIGR03617 family F420-dependent LLM class oxidoreductase [Gordonia alkanivorans]MDH3060115.1 TIGR03617 family F420-dependent LLM class oxidoreductase [Gordonia alkanivorans]
MRIHTALFGPQHAAERTRALRDVGVDGVFTFDGPHDVFSPLFGASGVDDVALMTNVAIAFPRNPITVAHQANDLQLLSGGRFTLGLGTQIRPQIEKRFGVPFERPVDRMVEFVAALRAIFDCWQNGARLDFDGEFYRHRLMTPMFNPGPNPHGLPPIFVGALGPRLTRAVAEHADGLLVMPSTTDRFVRESILPRVDAGLAASGRRREDFSVMPEIIVATGRTEEEFETSVDAARRLLSFYGSTPAYRPVLELHGYGDLQTELNLLSKQGRWAEMVGLVDDELLELIVAHGSPRDVAATIRARSDDIATDVAIYQPFPLADETLAEIMDGLEA